MDQLEIPMIEMAINWVNIKAYELEGEKKDNLLAVLNLAKIERDDIEAERDILQADNKRLRQRDKLLNEGMDRKNQELITILGKQDTLQAPLTKANRLLATAAQCLLDAHMEARLRCRIADHLNPLKGADV